MLGELVFICEFYLLEITMGFLVIIDLKGVGVKGNKGHRKV